MYHAAIVDNWLLGLVLRRSVCVCWPGILACQAAIVVGFPGRDLPARDQYVSGRYSGRPVRGLGLSAGEYCVSCRYSGTGYLARSYGDRCVLAGDVCWPGILACQAAIVVGFPGRDLPARDQYVSGRYSGRPGRGLGLSSGEYCVSCRYSGTGYLARSYGDRCVCVGRGSLRVRPL